MSAEIRIVALGAVRRGDEILVEEAEQPDTGERFFRLLGGGVEFGEHSRAAVRREFDEELGVSLVDPVPVGTFEEVFSYGGEPHHELWRVYEVDIAEEWPYERDRFTFHEPDLGTDHVARWLPIDALREEGTTFYTPRVLDALEL